MRHVTEYRDAGRKPEALEAAIYLTLAIDENADKADQRINDFMSAYYGRRTDGRKCMGCRRLFPARGTRRFRATSFGQN